MHILALAIFGVEAAPKSRERQREGDKRGGTGRGRGCANPNARICGTKMRRIGSEEGDLPMRRVLV